MGRYRALTKYFLTATKTVKEVLVEIEGQRMTGWRRNKHSQVWRGGGKALPQSPPTLLRAARLFSVAQLLSQFNQYSDVHDQLQPPPLASAQKFQIRYAHLISLWLPPAGQSNCSEWLWLHALVG